MKPTMTSRRPAATSASMIRSQASRVVASGFSQKTCLPAAMRGQHVLLVGRAPGGDHHGVDAVVADQVLPGLVHAGATGQPGRHRLGPVEVDVGHRGDPCPGQHRG